MRVCLLITFYLLCIAGWAQVSKPTSQRSELEVKGNNNTIRVIQAGTVIIYNLANKQEVQQFLGYLRSLPSIQKQLDQLSQKVDKTQQTVSRVEQRVKNQDKLLIEIAKNTAKEGFISLDEYNKGLEKYIVENNQLKAQVAQLQAQNHNTEFAIVLTQAEEKLKQLDNEGYQQALEGFKLKRKAKRAQEDQEYAQAAYLQAQNSYNQFQYEKALEQVEEALQYPLKAGSEYLLLKGDVLRVLYRLEKAIETYLLLSKMELSDTLRGVVYNNLGGAYDAKGEYDKAIKYFTKDLQIDLKVLGPEHPSVATTYNNLGGAYHNKGEYDKAIEYYTKALQISLKALGSEHPSVATIYNNLGGAYRYKGEYDKAIEYYTKALQIDLKVFGPEHPSVATDYNNLGVVYSNKGEYDKAIEYYTKDLQIDLKVFGPEHPSVATAYHNLGGAYSNKGEYERAIEYYTNALQIKLKTLGPEHPSTQRTLFNYGLTLVMAQQTPEAFTYIEQVKDHTALPLNSRINYFNGTGVGYFKDGKYQLAINFYRAALYVCEQSSLAKTDEQWAIVHQNMAKAYCYMGHKPEATKHFEQALVYSEPLTNKALKEHIEQNYDDCKKR